MHRELRVYIIHPASLFIFPLDTVNDECNLCDLKLTTAEFQSTARPKNTSRDRQSESCCVGGVQNKTGRDVYSEHVTLNKLHPLISGVNNFCANRVIRQRQKNMAKS